MVFNDFKAFKFVCNSYAIVLLLSSSSLIFDVDVYIYLLQKSLKPYSEKIMEICLIKQLCHWATNK